MPPIAESLSHIPLGVFPLFIGLVALGLYARRDRVSRVLLINALPLLGIMSLIRAVALGLPAIAALALGWAIGTALGQHLQPHWTVARDTYRVALRGETVTMITVLGLFIVNFAAGMIHGIAPQQAESAIFGLFYGGIAGTLSGSFAGRTLYIARMPVSDSLRG